MNSKISYYAIIPATVRYDDDLIPNAKLLYGEITALCNEKGYCWASNSYFAELYNVSERTITRWVSSLEAKGYIRTDLRYRSAEKEVSERRIYVANLMSTKMSTPPPTKMSEPLDKNVYHNNTVNNTTTTNVVADDGKSLSRFGIYHTIDEAIDAMKSDQIWKAMYGKQAGVTSLNDCDYWIDKYRDHAIASGKMSTSAKELKSHCLNWTRKRIQAGDTAPKVMTPEEKREARSKRFMTN